jgi:hypothetical protein
MRPVEFGEALAAGARSTLFSNDKPDRLFTVIQFWMDETSGVALALQAGVPTYLSRRGPAAPEACRRREEGRTHLPIHLPIEDDGHRWCLWRPDHVGSLRVARFHTYHRRANSLSEDCKTFGAL